MNPGHPIQSLVILHCVLYIYLRFQEDGYCEMTCAISFDAELLKKPIPYKYVIFSPKMKRKDDCYEFLHSFSERASHDPDRCLSITGTEHSKAIGGNEMCMC